ncbi:putative ATP-grasp-modified RiPP [Streptosporangium roseum]|uniref:putative ATP-grasp-modified RiPP n=1 Tax=Streptosporangium roseum TaxID=2001 RepID=UPI00069204B8|nr:putative ATP-grasp-modified RiPP [Streptosporangium roseum]
MTVIAERPPLPLLPWGLSRTTTPLGAAPALYDMVDLDPATQLTTFRDAAGMIVDMGNKVTVTTSKGGGSDGSSGSSNVADDSNADG